MADLLHPQIFLRRHIFFLERILVRVSRSKYRDQLVLKGGLCLSKFVKIERATKDIDFLLLRGWSYALPHLLLIQGSRVTQGTEQLDHPVSSVSVVPLCHF